MTIKQLISPKNKFIWFGLTILIVNLILTRFPLTGTFGYEFAAINGLLFVIISGLFTLNFLAKTKIHLPDLLVSLVLLVLLPLVVIVIKSLLTMFCSFWDGMLFYMLIVFTSVLFGTALAFLTDFYLNRFKKLFLILIVSLITFIPIVEIYFLPQVYFYSPLIGFFPGNIYDEGLSPDIKLLLHQVIVFCFSSSIIYLVIRFRYSLTKIKNIFAISLLIVVVGFQLSSSLFGYITTFTKLENALPNKIQSDKFCVHYDNMNLSEAEYIALNIEYYYSELIRKLNVIPSNPIQIFLFNDRVQKKILFGAGNADVAKPWQSAIYISVDSWERTLKHELVHVFSAEFGTGLFKLASRFNPALIEGLAESIEGNADEISLVDFTALAFNHNHKVDVSSLFSGFNFFKANSSIGYTYSGAFITFLIEKYGIEKVKWFYANGDYDYVFEKNIRSDQKEFERKLESSFTFSNQAMADYYFGRLSIIQKVCPRYVADRLIDAYNYLNNDQLEQSEKLLQEINSKTLNYSALVGLSEINRLKKKSDEAIGILKSNLSTFNGTPYYYTLLFRIADLHALNSEIDSSKYYYEKILFAQPNYELSFLCKTKLSLLNANLLKDYIGSNDSTKYNLITKLVEDKFEYNSVPVLLSLSKRIKVDYKSEIKNFNKTFIVDNLESSYAAFKLSQYLLSNGDYVNGRKYAALSLRFKDSNPFYFSMKENFGKANWLYVNALDVLESFNMDESKIVEEIN